MSSRATFVYAVRGQGTPLRMHAEKLGVDYAAVGSAGRTARAPGWAPPTMSASGAWMVAQLRQEAAADVFTVESETHH